MIKLVMELVEKVKRALDRDGAPYDYDEALRLDPQHAPTDLPLNKAKKIGAGMITLEQREALIADYPPQVWATRSNGDYENVDQKQWGVEILYCKARKLRPFQVMDKGHLAAVCSGVVEAGLLAARLRIKRRGEGVSA